MAVSKSKMETNHKWDNENYDRIAVLLPKGSKAMIESLGETNNGFMNKAFKEYCDKHGYSYK